MPRKDRYKGVHTGRKTAGVQNMKPEIIANMRRIRKDENQVGDKILEAMQHGHGVDTNYPGGWDEDSLRQEIMAFFEWCAEREMKPTQPLLRLWLHVDKSTMWAWKNNPERYGYKSKLIKEALEALEAHLQSNIEKYPTGNIFLLKTSHGHVETSKLDITQSGEKAVSEAEIKDAVAKLGLDK